ncbi:hypothetical protein BU23DRAFT_566741 [Bimuria novae-zelandiae CBS 107.79]|uniref:Uncharacterized protein n=1 Tax=Bimuria novae-zelandiae CBS 107.79 TaxID=1447943 RepID=A0A6A5VJH8_9PLEO|nr:hypothetical protein BU23DRAFT_566741 [Bimuria novae-zelandiae CBS 107.79]
MNSSLDHEPWDFVQPVLIMPTTLADTEQQPPAKSAEPQAGPNTTTKMSEPTAPEQTGVPRLERNEIGDYVSIGDVEYSQRGASRPVDLFAEFVPPPHLHPAARRVPPPPPRRYNYSPSPPRYHDPPFVSTPQLDTSSQLLDFIHYDGVVKLPFPAQSHIFITTFPFTNKHVQEWSWLFQLDIEEKYLHKPTEVTDDDVDSETEWYSNERRGRINRPIRMHRGRRDRFPNFDNTIDFASVYLSRALDRTVIPEASEKDFTYIIVVKNRGMSGGGAKKLTADSRKAAGILMYYEALIGNSVAFVGAVREVTDDGENVKTRTYKKVDSVYEAVKAAEEGVFGVLC